MCRLYVFPIYNGKLHDICSTSNLVHPPFKKRLQRHTLEGKLEGSKKILFHLQFITLILRFNNISCKSE